ncbi:hypothetical protein PACTADRAFT_49154 [Pachysolen tannophilus NRRL Y-2460]|uniref:OPA3-like protein n=1 Tax=Pachysolen tannophilus NRRL Y-2460 TaxID=669874 RepID=A0A1E4U095_PACTA|nr:hypothetical protein PACTADRAFT_49154 [Pachysolen tannophilus NRRL Y-2460]
MSSIALKLTSLAVRTIAKPMGNAIRSQAKEHAKFKHVCVTLAQRLHQLDSNLKIRLLGQKNIKIRPLNENKAIEQGASFLSEAFIFTVAGSLIIYESFRARMKELNRREAVADDIAVLQDEIEFLKKNLHVNNKNCKLSKEYHPLILKIDEKDGNVKVNEMELQKQDNMSAAAIETDIKYVAQPINLVISKLNEKDAELFQSTSNIRVKDLEIVKDKAYKDSYNLFLKIEKIDKLETNGTGSEAAAKKLDTNNSKQQINEKS